MRKRSLRQHAGHPAKQASKSRRHTGSLPGELFRFAPVRHASAKTLRRPAPSKNAVGKSHRMPAEKTGPQDYGEYRFPRDELIKNLLLFAALDAAVSILFYRSWIAFLIFTPAAVPFLRARKNALMRKRSLQMLAEFTTGMQMVNASLQAGYAIENAFREALVQLVRIYPEDSFIITEFRYILSQTGLNVPVEELLLDLGRRTHLEDIRNFAEVFQTAKRTGGDMIGIIRGAVTSIQAKTQTREEIETSLSGKASEQRVMSAAPLFLIAYTSLTSPGFLDVCYHNLLGVGIMTFCLVLYLAAFLWGSRIMRIEV